MSLNALSLQRLLKRFFIVLVTLVIGTCYFLQFRQNAFNISSESDRRTWKLYDFSSIPNDKGKVNQTFITNEVTNYLHSLPIDYWNNRNKKQDKSKCGGVRSLFDLKFANNHWQVFNHSDATFFLLNAFYDNRVKSGNATVRVLATVNRLEPKHKITCQMWFKDAQVPVLSPVSEFKYVWQKAFGAQSLAYQQPYLISCDIPINYRNSSPPLAVSLVEHDCDRPHNLLKVHNKRPSSGVKEDFAVCVKGLSFQYNDQSVILIEWLESLFSMGVSKVFIYVLNIHPNMWKVLEHYVSLGKIEVRKHTLSGHYPNVPGFQQDFLKGRVGHKRLEELMPYNDCYYENMYMYKFISLLDIDELIVPKGHLMTWKDLLDFLEPSLKHKPEDVDGYAFRNVFFHDGNYSYEGIPKYLRIANLITRDLVPHRRGDGPKSWFSTENVKSLHNHYSFNLLTPNRKPRPKKWHEVDPNVAHMHHYCFNKVCKLGNVTLDNTIWKYKDRVIRESLKVLEDLQFISKKQT